MYVPTFFTSSPQSAGLPTLQRHSRRVTDTEQQQQLPLYYNAYRAPNQQVKILALGSWFFTPSIVVGAPEIGGTSFVPFAVPNVALNPCALGFPETQHNLF